MSATILSTSTPVSKKARRCHGCGLLINAGERHEASAISYDGTVYTTRLHMKCAALWNNLIASGVLDASDELGEGDLREYL